MPGIRGGGKRRARVLGDAQQDLVGTASRRFDAVVGGVAAGGKATTPVATLLRLRFSVWQNRLPVDALPLEGWIELRLWSEEDLMELAF